MLRPLTATLLLAWMIAPASSVIAWETDNPIASQRIDWRSIGQSSNQIVVTHQQEVVSILTEGDDPFFRFQMPVLSESTRDWIFELDYFCPQGISRPQWRSGKGIHRATATSLPDIPVAEGWTKYTLNLNEIDPDMIRVGGAMPVRIDLGVVPGIKLQVRSVIVRPISPEESRRQSDLEERQREKEALEERIGRYRSRAWPATIEVTRMDACVVELVGNIGTVDAKASPEDTVKVVTRSPASISANGLTERELSEKWPVTIDPATGRFHASVSVPDNPPASEDNTCDLPGMRFQLVRQSGGQWQPISPAVYPPPVFTHSASPDLAPVKSLHAAKGLTCITSRFSSDQLRELGLEHASVNMVVSGLVSRSARPGWEPAKIHGESWWVNEPRLKHQDRDIRTAADAGAVVAAILLIPNSHRHPAPIAHPDAVSAGTYAMPNLTDQNSVANYAAALEVLGRRYSGASPQHGRVDHWIVHNEVDYGWQWTNMGEQPLAVFMDHYVRSMRLVDAAARRHNPHARVFISLTHRWNTVKNQHWKTYPPKAMLQWLIQDSKLEGDFPWGVAYHPYPQSLWKADFWNDRQVSDDFDTELITIKNLQVLDRFMHLETSRTVDGVIRPVICSEQGFHADENSPEQLQIQAAALLLTWQKLRECPSILAFDYHRPSDHPNEGGLRLGLRGLPSGSNRLGAPKPAWKVYSAIGTDREAEMIRRYRDVWESK